jgi:hypothetical protein
MKSCRTSRLTRHNVTRALTENMPKSTFNQLNTFQLRDRTGLLPTCYSAICRFVKKGFDETKFIHHLEGRIFIIPRSILVEKIRILYDRIFGYSTERLVRLQHTLIQTRKEPRLGSD